MSAIALYNLVPHSPDAQSERLKRFRESQDVGVADGKGGDGCYSDNDMDEAAMHSQENPEESAHESDGEGEDGNSGQDDSHDRRGDRANTPQHPGSSSTYCSSDKCLHPHSSSWGSECESEGAEESGRPLTQEDDTVEERFSESTRSSHRVC